jgi:hypothetical protein
MKVFGQIPAFGKRFLKIIFWRAENPAQTPPFRSWKTTGRETSRSRFEPGNPDGVG